MVSNFKIHNMSLNTKQVSKSSSIFNFTPSSRILPQFRVSFLPITRLHCLSLSSSPSTFSNLENPPIKYPFKVRYVINTFGWSPEIAITATKYLNFETPEKPDRVLAFLKKHGFSKTQMSRVVRNWPQILRCNPDETLLPKLKFLSNLGLSRTEITDVVIKAPRILNRSLENIVIPNFNLISNLLNSSEEAVKMLKRDPIIFASNLELEKIQILLEAGVPTANILASRTGRPKCCEQPPASFRKLVEEVKELGFDPCSMHFMWAVQNISSLSESSLIVEVLKKYGWSDSDIFLAFGKYPMSFGLSKDKIEAVMDFLVNKMGIEATDVANWPAVFRWSLQKRIVPRCSVYQSMVEKGLCKKKYNLEYLCNTSEDKFIAWIMKHCENQAPELLDFYNKILDVRR